MSPATLLGIRSLVMGTFAMVHAFWPLTRGDNSVVTFGVVAALLAILDAGTSRVVQGVSRVAFTTAAVFAGAVAVWAVVGGVVVGPAVLVPAVVTFGVVVGALEGIGAWTSSGLPRVDHLVLAGLSLILGLASLVGPNEPAWLSGTLVAWASMTAVFAGTASVQWKDQAAGRNGEGTPDVDQ